MTNKRQRLIVAVLVAFSSLSYGTGQAETSEEIRAASALFGQFETVAYTRTDFPSSSNTNDPQYVDSLVNLKLPFEELIGAVNVLGQTAATNLRRSYGSVLVGAKDFVPPHGIGAIGSRKCYVGVLEGGVQPNVEADFGRASYELIGRRRVWIWSAPPPAGTSSPTTFYAAQIANAYFVMANNRVDFEQVAEALTLGDGSMPAQIKAFGWSAFSTRKYWLFRSIHRDAIISPVAAGTKDMSTDVTALVFIADVDQRRGYIMVLSSDRDLTEAPGVFPNSELIRLQPQGSGIWQATIPLSKDRAGFNSLFRVFCSFGFGAVL